MPDSSEAAKGRVWRGYALAVLAAACWATGGLTAKWLFSPLDATSARWPFPPPGLSVDPVVLAGARALVAALLLLAYVALFRREELKIVGRDIPFLAVFGVAGLAGVHVTYFKAISYTNVATAILLEYLAPVLVLAFSVIFLRVRPTWALPVGVTLSVTGCALVVGAIGGDGLSVSTPGLTWGLLSAVFFALYSLLGEHAATRFSAWKLLTYGLLAAAIFWLVYLRGLGSILELLSHPAGLGVVLYMAVFATIVPFAAFLSALHHIDATRAVITSTLEPVIAGVIAYLLLGESLSLSQLAGGALVIAAIIVIQRHPGVRPAEELPPLP